MKDRVQRRAQLAEQKEAAARAKAESAATASVAEAEQRAAAEEAKKQGVPGPAPTAVEEQLREQEAAPHS